MMDGADEGPIVMDLDLDYRDDPLSPDGATSYLSPRDVTSDAHQAPPCGATSSQDTESETELTPGIRAHFNSAMRLESDDDGSYNSVRGSTSSLDTEETESETELETESETELETESETELETESETELKIESETELETESETELETESETELETESETELEIESETELEAESGTEQEIESETELEIESETELETESETEPEAESETELETESETELEIESETELETDSETELEIESETELTPGDSAHSNSASTILEGLDSDDDGSFISIPELPITSRSRPILTKSSYQSSSSERPGSFEFSNRLYYSNPSSRNYLSNSVTDNGSSAINETEKEDTNCFLRKCRHCGLIVATIRPHHSKHHENIPLSAADYEQYSKSLDEMIEHSKLRMYKKTSRVSEPQTQYPLVETDDERCSQEHMKIFTCYSIDITEFDTRGNQLVVQNSEGNEALIQRPDLPVSTSARPSVSNSHSVSNSASTSVVPTVTASSSSSLAATSTLPSSPSSHEPVTSAAAATSAVSLSPSATATAAQLTEFRSSDFASWSPHPMPSYHVPTITSDVKPCSSTHPAPPSELINEETNQLEDTNEQEQRDEDANVDHEAASSVGQDFQEPIHCIHCGITYHNGNDLRAHFFQTHAEDHDYYTFDASISALERRRAWNRRNTPPEQADLTEPINCIHCDLTFNNINTMKAHFFQEHSANDFQEYENFSLLFARIRNPRSNSQSRASQQNPEAPEESGGLEPNGHFLVKLEPPHVEPSHVGGPDASDEDDDNRDSDALDDGRFSRWIQMDISNQSDPLESSQFRLRDCYVRLEDVTNMIRHTEDAPRVQNWTEARCRKRKASASESDVPDKHQRQNDRENVPESPMSILNALLHIPEIPNLPRAVYEDCPVCEQAFPTSALANMHILAKHCQEILNISPALPCPVCKEAFHGPLSLYGHILYTHKKITVKTASEAKRQWKQVLERMGGEMVDSNDEANYVQEGSCPMCGVTTGNQSLFSHIVWSHSKQITGKKLKFKCSICDDAYYSASSASKHIREKHEADKNALRKVSAALDAAKEIIGPVAFTERYDITQTVERADAGNTVPTNLHFCDNKATLNEMLKIRKKQEYRWMKAKETTGRHCPICQKESSSVINNTSHIVSEHGHQLTNKKLILNCSLCDFSSSKYMCVSRHIYREHATHARQNEALSRLTATRKGKAFLKVVKLANRIRAASPVSWDVEEREAPWRTVLLQGNKIELTRNPAG